MVSAVFHSPREAAAAPAASAAPATASRPIMPAATAQPAPAAKPARDPIDWKGVALRVLPPIISIALLIGLWGLATQKGGSFPTPAATFDAAVKLFSDPFYRNGPNDQGIGWNILNSLATG